MPFGCLLAPYIWLILCWREQARTLLKKRLTHSRLFRRRLDMLWAEWFLERIGELITARKVLDAVLVRFAEHFTLDQIKDDIPEISAFLDPPMLQNGSSHGPVLIDRKESNALQELGPRKMVRLIELSARV